MTSFVARRLSDGLPVRVILHSGLISSIESVPLDSVDPEAIPYVGSGLFDIQINGYGGHWFCSERLNVDTVEQIVVDLVARGVSEFFPTLITCSADAMTHGLQVIRAACEQREIVSRVVCGCHLEGPYISPAEGARGAHPIQHVRSPDWSEFESWQKASGNRIRLMTLAPEVPGAESFIRRAVASGVRIAIGHTAADPEQIGIAVNAGATLSTHLGNGCAATMNRHRNVFWPQLSDDRLTASLIADGWHLPSELLQTVLRCKTADRVILTCDVSGFGGCAAGRYATGDIEVDVLDDGRLVVAGQSQYLAGSGVTTGDCVIHMTKATSIGLQEAWQMASTRPAQLFGHRIRRRGAIGLEAGDVATLTLFRIEHSLQSKEIPTVGSRFVPVATAVEGQWIMKERE